MPRRDPRWLGCLSLIALLPACGGGGTDPEPPPVVVVYDQSTLSGTYTVLTVSGSVAPSFEVETGTAVADALGQLDVTLTTNRDGVISGPASVSLRYEVAADGTLEVRDPLDLDVLHGEGAVSADGQVAMFASMDDGDRPRIALLMRRGMGYSNASLDLHYQAVGFGGLLASGDTFAVQGESVADGVGGLSIRTLFGPRTYIGQVHWTNIHHVDFGGPYSIAADGATDLTTGGEDFAGMTGLNGQVAGFGGALGAEAAPSVYFVTKESSSATNALFAGPYWHVCLVRLRAGGYRAYTGPVWADGDRNVTVGTTSNTDGVIATDPPWSTWYAVEPMGRFGINGVLNGAITLDGRFIVGNMAPPLVQALGLAFFVRRQ